MKRFLPVMLLALSLVVVAGCDNRNTFGVNGHDKYDLPVVPGVIRQETVAKKLIGDEPLSVVGGDNEMNEIFSLTMHVHVRAGREERLFERAYERRRQRIVDSVETIMRQSTYEERREVDLATIKEKSKQAINEILEIPWVQRVLISKVTFEQIECKCDVAELACGLTCGSDNGQVY